MLELNKLYNMDCMDGMKQFPDKYFDLAVVDPPYGIGIGNMNFTKSGAIRPSRNVLAVRRDYRMEEDWDKARPDKNYFNELMRISKNQIIWGGNYFSDILPASKSFIVWDKRTNEKYNNDFADCEIAWCSKGVARIFRYLWCGMLQDNMKDKELRIHPTQKPVDLYNWILRHYAKPSYKIIDTHAGSASSLVACEQSGFDYIGFEIDNNYYNMALKRLEAEKSQIKLFDTVKFTQMEMEY